MDIQIIRLKSQFYKGSKNNRQVETTAMDIGKGSKEFKCVERRVISRQFTNQLQGRFSVNTKLNL